MAGSRANERNEQIKKGTLAFVLLLALFLRLYKIDVFLAGDETKWICRSINFHAALRQRDLASTYQSEHPGVVTMWVGTLAVPLSLADEWVGLCAETGGSKLTRVHGHTSLEALPGLIFRARRFLTVFTWMGLVVVALLLWRLFDISTSLIATILLSLDPFLLALSRVLHLDAILSIFLFISILSLAIFLFRERKWKYLFLSGAAAGIAIANKSPGLFLFPWVGLVLALYIWYGEPSRRSERFRQALFAGFVWGALSLATIFLLWPSLWVNPWGTLKQVLGAALGYAAKPHGNSNYFWFAIRPDPGPGFYPVAWIFRTTPLVVLGLIFLAFFRKGRPSGEGLFLGGFAILYTLFMTLGAKKFDRYLLPVFLPLDVLAALGWVAFYRWFRSRSLKWPQLGIIGALILILGQFALLWPKQPYYFSYYNPLAGGASVAQKILLIGWGEGMEKAAAYLNTKPGVEEFHVNTAHIAQFAPFFRGRTSSASDLDLAESDYYVFYRNTIQRWRVPEVLGRFYGVETPEHVVRVHGIDYVWIYANTLFRPAVEYLEGVVDPQKDIVLLDVRSALLRHYKGTLRLVYLDGTGPEDEIIRGLARVADGKERIWYLTFPETPGDPRGLIHKHLEEQGQLVQEAHFEGMDVACYQLLPGAQFRVPSPSHTLGVRFGEKIHLLGYDLQWDLSRQLVRLRLYWRANAPIEKSYTVFTHLLGPNGQKFGQHDGLPKGGSWPTNRWIPGETVLDEHILRVAQGAPPGKYQLAVGLYELSTGQRLSAFDRTGAPLPENRVLIGPVLWEGG
ncbi:MAG: phospholipid carrier-dependent glycosyltransferase [Anaerolineae bacterium]|nr:phospholipid carrier-dependent glycosyltransferase [Anaerolineae bacterium]